MTIEELAKLSDEELRFKCAELCGWTRLNWNTWEHKDSRMSVWPTTSVPNYPADLNAMHEAEKMLAKPSEWIGYISFLEPLADSNGAGFIVHVTARQRCIAFIAVKQQPVEVKGGGE
jgi:hypothetical protein